VWGFDLPKDMPGAKMIPHAPLRQKYGDFFFTSTVAWMFAMAIECMRITEDEEKVIGLWGVDMAATEEYGYQRAGCQYFAQLAQGLGITMYVPPESDLLTPPPLYGLFESTHRGIKLTSRKREIDSRLAMAEQKKAMADQEVAFLKGAVDDLQYHLNNWLFEEKGLACNYPAIFPTMVTEENQKEPTEEST
jgi:hypothetical protein